MVALVRCGHRDVPRPGVLRDGAAQAAAAARAGGGPRREAARGPRRARALPAHGRLRAAGDSAVGILDAGCGDAGLCLRPQGHRHRLAGPLSRPRAVLQHRAGLEAQQLLRRRQGRQGSRDTGDWQQGPGGHVLAGSHLRRHSQGHAPAAARAAEAHRRPPDLCDPRAGRAVPPREGHRHPLDGLHAGLRHRRLEGHSSAAEGHGRQGRGKPRARILRRHKPRA
mmetsp:Transcript_40839/g.89099  ORF Transcript_40839/g.89099 Transcript_40839/m.89099 type:complete len:224 (-) Transcript_40839:390-1061(-)